MVPVWKNVSFTPEAERELARVAVHCNGAPIGPDSPVPVLINTLSMTIDGKEVCGFQRGYRCGMLKMSSITDEVWIQVQPNLLVALRADEFMTPDDAYAIDYSGGVYLVTAG